TATYVGHASGIVGPALSSLPYFPNVVIALLLVSTTSMRNCPRFGKNTRPNGSTSKPDPSHMQWAVLPDMCAEYGEYPKRTHSAPCISPVRCGEKAKCLLNFTFGFFKSASDGLPTQLFGNSFWCQMIPPSGGNLMMLPYM